MGHSLLKHMRGYALDSWDDGGDAVAVFAEGGAEAAFEFGVFCANHERTGHNGPHDHCKDGAGLGEGEPAEHGAEVSEIKRVAHTSVESGGDEHLLVAVGFEFGASDDLVEREVAASAEVDEGGERPAGDREE